MEDRLKVANSIYSVIISDKKYHFLLKHKNYTAKEKPKYDSLTECCEKNFHELLQDNEKFFYYVCNVAAFPIKSLSSLLKDCVLYYSRKYHKKAWTNEYYLTYYTENYFNIDVRLL